MIDITFEYWNKLADQTILISSLLAGFSIAVIANLLASKINTSLLRKMMMAATMAASFFLVTVFAMTKVLLMTTNGYPFEVVNSDLLFPRILGTISFFLGIVSLITVIALAGWTKSKRMGLFTTVAGIFTLILIIFLII